jgi:hypothetical protein
MSDLIFWYTGYVIWLIIALLVAVITLVACLTVYYRAYDRVKRWATLKSLMDKNVTLDDIDDMRMAYNYANHKYGKQLKDGEDGFKWLLCVAENYKHRKSLDNKENNNDSNITTG